MSNCCEFCITLQPRAVRSFPTSGDYHDSGSPGSSITCCLQQTWQRESCDFIYFIHLIFDLPFDLFLSPIPSIIVFSRASLHTTCPKYESFVFMLNIPDSIHASPFVF